MAHASKPRPHPARGFSLLELVLVMAIFLVVTSAVFGLLTAAQRRYSSEKDFLASFQNARQGVDMVARDVHSAGYPPAYTYATNQVGLPSHPLAPPAWTNPSDPALPGDLTRRFAIPFLGFQFGAPNQTCQVNIGCNIPGPFDLLMEADTDPLNPNESEQVEWVHYRLVPGPPGGTATLMRAVVNKDLAAFPNPLAATVPNLVLFVENVLNDPTDPADAVFHYECGAAVASCIPEAIQTVIVTLRVRSDYFDPNTQRYRIITLQAAARKVNPLR